MKSYKLYTEWVGPETFDTLSDIITPHFPGWNYSICNGVWKGKPEAGVVIEIVAGDNFEWLVHSIAYSINKELKQEAVLVTSTKLDDACLISIGGYEPLGDPKVTPDGPMVPSDECACCENCCECNCGKG